MGTRKTGSEGGNDEEVGGGKPREAKKGPVAARPLAKNPLECRVRVRAQFRGVRPRLCPPSITQT